MTDVRYVDYGIANNLGDVIEVNEDLRKYPRLYTAVMQHELKHTDKNSLNYQDFLVDMEETKINYKELLKFMFKYPRSFFQFSPFYITKGTFYYDINMTLTWLFSILLVGLAVYLIAY